VCVRACVRACVRVCVCVCVCAAVTVDSSHMTPLRGVDSVISVHFQISLMGTCRQCGSWSVAGHNHRKVIGRDPICASLHDMGLDLSGNGSSETMFDEGDRNLAVR